jgi:hypothetical protein
MLNRKRTSGPTVCALGQLGVSLDIDVRLTALGANNNKRLNRRQLDPRLILQHDSRLTPDNG